MKKLYLVGLMFILTLFLFGCTIKNDNVETPTEGTPNKEKSQTIHQGFEKVVASLIKVKDDGHSFQYVIKNTSQNALTLTFNTSQEFNYILWRKDAKGTMIYAYDKDKSFKTDSHSKVLKPNEELSYDIELSQDFEPNTYILEAYMTSNEPQQSSLSKFHKTIEFNITNSQ